MNNLPDKTAMIRVLNDRFRKTLSGGAVLMSRGVAALGPELQVRILAAVQAFDTFDEDNDPWAEHAFGAIDVPVSEGTGNTSTVRVFFTIEYYDLTRAHAADDPADESRTERVMTILLAEEY